MATAWTRAPCCLGVAGVFRGREGGVISEASAATSLPSSSALASFPCYFFGPRAAGRVPAYAICPLRSQETGDRAEPPPRPPLGFTPSLQGGRPPYAEVIQVLCPLSNSALPESSLVVQWLGLHASAADRLGSVPGQGTKIPKAELHGQKGKKKSAFPGYREDQMELS